MKDLDRRHHHVLIADQAIGCGDPGSGFRIAGREPDDRGRKGGHVARPAPIL